MKIQISGTKTYAFHLLCLLLLLNSCRTLKKQVSEPYKPYVILKLDDLWCEQEVVHKGWQQVVDFLNEENVKGTIGIVGNSLEKEDEAYFNWIKEREQEGYEIWHHGFCHCRQKEGNIEIREYRGKNYEEQLESLKNTQKLAKEKLDITLHSFGAPYNSTDEFTAQALEEMPDIKVWMYKETKALTNKYLLDRIKEVNIEYPVHQPDFEQFKLGYKQFKNEPILIIQGHPRSWVEEESRFEVFKKIILFLKKEGVNFITPYEYYLKDKASEK